MKINQLLYQKSKRIFPKFFLNPIEDQEIHPHLIGEEGTVLGIKIIDVNKNGLIFKIDIDDVNFFVIMHDETECAHVLMYEDENNVIDTDSEFGDQFDFILNLELLKVLEYLESSTTTIDFNFDKISIHNFNVSQNYDSKLVLKFKSGETEINVDFGMGNLIKELDDEKIPTLQACCCGSITGNFLSLYCSESDKDKIINKIKSHFSVGKDGVLVEEDKDLVSISRKNLIFKW